MPPRTAALVAGALALLGGCARYDFQHELRLHADGSGEVVVRGRPELWRAFKGVEGGSDEQLVRAARALLESARLDIRDVRVRRLGSRAELVARAGFDHVGQLNGTPAFADLSVSLEAAGERLALEGRWGVARPRSPLAARGEVAVRVRAAARIHHHADAAEGVERGNVLTWRQPLARALAGEPIVFAAELGRESVLGETLTVLLAAMATAVALLAGAIALAVRRGRRERRRAGARPAASRAGVPTRP